MQIIHEDDVGTALQLCVVGAGPPGAYNIAPEQMLAAANVTAGGGPVVPLPLPAESGGVRRPGHGGAVLLPPAAQWVEAASHPVIVDTTRAKKELGWTPRFTALEALRDTVIRRSRRRRSSRGG